MCCSFFVYSILVGASVKRATVYKVREKKREVVASVVTTACGEDIEREVVASVFIFCTFSDSDSLQ